MPKRYVLIRSAIISLVRRAVLAGPLAALLGAADARADFAAPPPSPYQLDDRKQADRPQIPDPGGDAALDAPVSTLRFHVGPALMLEPMRPGLLTALDIGQRAVGVRVSAAWLRAESEQGLAAYTGELWIDLRHRSELHPILGAGASLLHGGALGKKSSAGAGVLRGALEYALPIDGDARLSLDLLAWVPAIGTERTRPWAVSAFTVGASF